MRADPRGGAGGVVTAPRHQAERQAVSTAGTDTVAQTHWLNQQPELAGVTRRLARRHRLPISIARVYAEARCAHV